MLAGMLKTTRPKQWVKNLFVLAPAVFAKDLFHGDVLLRALGAFAAFSLLAGAIYTINDLVDVEDDRQHPTKRHRPIAAGRVPVRAARLLATGLITTALSLATALDYRVGLVAAAYLVKDLAYSLRPLRLKDVAYVDVGLIALGFVFRVTAGSFAVSTVDHPVRPSGYLILCTAFLALFLGFGKRWHELMTNSSKAREVLERYGRRALGWTLWFTGLATLAVYLAWTLDPPQQLVFAKGYLWSTTPLVLLAMMRFVRLLSAQDGESPTDAMLRDVPFVLIVLSWALLIVTMIYQLRPAG